MCGTCSIWFSMRGNNVTEVRPGSGMSLLLLAVTALRFAISGQSLIPRGAVLRVLSGVVVKDFFAVVSTVLTGCLVAFGFVQQLWAAAGSQLSPSTTVSSDSTVSAANTCMLLQPNRQPPAIHTDTIKARRTRGILMNRANFIDRSLLRKTQKHKDLASVM